LHSWSCLCVVFLHGSMLWLYNINILSMPFKFSYPKLYISHSCRALRQKKDLGEDTYTNTTERFERTIWGSNIAMFFWKILSKTPILLEKKKWSMSSVRAVPFLNRPRWCSSDFKTHRYEYVTWNIFYACIIS
jgi:hypothetical protein